MPALFDTRNRLRDLQTGEFCRGVVTVRPCFPGVARARAVVRAQATPSHSSMGWMAKKATNRAATIQRAGEISRTFPRLALMTT